MNLTRILIDGSILSLAMGVLIFGSLWYNPRLWLQDYPKVIQAKVAPLNSQEKRVQRFLLALFLIMMIGIPFWSAAQLGADASFLAVYVTVVLITNMFNLFDALVIDWLVLTLMKPKFMIVPEAEGMEEVLFDPKTQLMAYFKGIVFCALLSLPITAAVVVIV